jgi:fatty-acyl-CoA synthase
MVQVSARVGLRVVVVAGGDVPLAADDPVLADYESAMATDPLPRRKHDASDPIIMLTGGTTGVPKGVVWTHSGVGAVVLSACQRMGLEVPVDGANLLRITREQLGTGRSPVVLPASPLMHGTGFFGTLGNLLLGGRVVCLTSRSFDPAELWTAVQRRRVNEVAIVGNAFAVPMVEELDRAASTGAPYDISSLRRVVSSGMPWTVDVKKRFLQAGDMTLHDSIASTEGGPYAVSIVSTGDEPHDFGFTLPDNARLVTPDGTLVEAGTGELGMLASAGNLPVGYLDDPARTAATFRMVGGERLAVPGDVASVGADGAVVFHGRGVDVINTGGEKVFAEEVEAALCRHPAVGEAVVLGVADDRWGSRIVALVLPVPGRQVSEEELSLHVGRSLASYKRPRRVFFIDSIDRSISGKIDRARARQRVDELLAAVETRG